MAIKRYVVAKEGPGEDPSKKRIQQLDTQIKQARELLKKAKESDPKSERVFNLQQRVNTLTTQKDRAKKRADDRKDNQKEEKAKLTCRCTWKPDCPSTTCPESVNYNVLTQI